MTRSTQRRPVTRFSLDRDPVTRPDTLAAEEPLEIRVAGRRFAVTMRTPGNDFDLAAGFLVSEGVVARGGDIVTTRYCAGETADGSTTYNVLDVTLAPHVPPPDPQLAREHTTTSACGLCGKASISAVRTHSHHPVADDAAHLSASALLALPARLREQQRLFETTGGLHAAGLVDTATGNLLVVREDVGRHNAVDKVIGWALANDRLPLTGTALQVSGRASFELVQKASMAGIPILAAVSAPSSLAVDLAVEVGLTLAGFVRERSFVLYSRPDRIDRLRPDGADARPR
ncbi:formate dehydrogenase accessory sulfurtransferase FdhD [Serinibacter salmoneus]|uniref:Sulfur carrier protein FdhD n=1 Tax=Serinibacter salmoneus TaxID=556530 RepID=A0A2A9D3Q9_9MICO|nr:formate dehydrogenase accessory sulfurtransferase FdhD [Serinibacter salmoneus]PFG21021.1 FdhD protein [Serinibacter salmoneus]